MKTKSAWSRGLLYGSVVGGVMSVFPVAAMIFGNAPLSEFASVGGIVVAIWGGLGFLVGYASYSESTNELAGNPVATNDVSLFKRLLYRFIAGLLLSYGVAAVVSGIGYTAFFLWHGDVNTPRNLSEMERRMVLIGFCGMIGVEMGAIAGCWLGAMLMQGGNKLGPIARRAFHSAAVGGLAGGWIGGLAGGLLFLLHSEREFAMFIIGSAIGGYLAGISAAIFVRRRGRW